MELPNGFSEAIISWWTRQGRSFPWRDNPSVYEIIVAEVLLQASAAEKVEPVYETLIDEYPDPHELANANNVELEKILRPLGLQTRKAAWLITIAERLVEEEIPNSYDSFINLPGLGAYSVNAVLCFACGERRPIVDTNVVRIYNRVFSMDLRDSEDPQAWDFSRSILPLEESEIYNLGLLDLGAEICTDRNPSCEECPLSKYCDFYTKTQHSNDVK